MKSDSSNGVFALSSTSLEFSAVEGDNITVAIDRSVGTFGSVVVNLEVRLVSGGVLGDEATDDFYPSSAAVTFAPGQTIGVSCVLELSQH